MINNNKSFFHYRNAFKSDHLASADIEELQEYNNGVAILTIIKIEYFENRIIAGRKKDKSLIAFFKETDTKPLVVNAKNSKILAKFIGSSNVNEWNELNLPIELYVDYKVKLSGSIVSGIRIRPSKPIIKLEPVVNLKGAFEWLQKKGNTIEKLKQIKSLSKHQEEEIKKMQLSLNSKK